MPSNIESIQEETNVSLLVNGEKISAKLEPRMLLVDFIRERCKLTGTHIGCDTSNCGACTIIVNGLTVKSCTMFAAEADGSEIFTVEGLTKNGSLRNIQESFWNHNALQCGYCTPGFLLSSYFLLHRVARPSEDEIKEALVGNVCRCTGYIPIIRAIEELIAREHPGK